MLEQAHLVHCSGVSFRFGQRTVLHDVELSVARGEIVTLIGPNGAGKTTLVKLILGLLRPSSGQVRCASGISVGYLPQNLTLDPVLPLTVRRLLTITHRAARSRQDRVLDLLGIRHLAEAEAQQLSGGEQRRVLLARALLREPDLLVLDEPSQGVDFSGAAELYQLIATLRDEHGFGVLMISHDLHLVMAATDRVICLNQHVCCAGEPESVQRHPEYLALFEPGVADKLAVYAHRHDHRHQLSGAVVAEGEEQTHG